MLNARVLEGEEGRRFSRILQQCFSYGQVVEVDFAYVSLAESGEEAGSNQPSGAAKDLLSAIDLTSKRNAM